MKLHSPICVVVFSLFVLCGSARADVIIAIGSELVPQGGTATFDVWLSSSAPADAPDIFNESGFEFQITGPNQLQFAVNQTFEYLNDPAYVYANDSFDVDSSTPGGYVETSVYSNDTFLGYDGTNDFSNISLSTASSPLLLASLSLYAPANEVAIGDVFTVSVVAANTYFDQYLVGGTTLNFTSASGTATITGATVPEPSSIVSGIAAFFVLGVAAWSRSFRRRESSATSRARKHLSARIAHAKRDRRASVPTAW